MMRDMVVLINLDGAVCRSTARRLRAEHIYCKILPADATAQDILSQDALGVLLTGGATGEPAVIPHLSSLMDCGLPLLGMGDAALTLCEAMHGSLNLRAAEPGVRQVRFADDDVLFAGVESGERYLAACRCMVLPAACTAIAAADEGVLGFHVDDKPIYGFAFLPEQNDPDSNQLLINFCKSICGCTLWWSSQAFMERAQEEISRLADGGEAVCALSGGVDSGVCALLANRALGSRLHCFFIDTGLLRKGEGDEVMSFYRDELGLSVKRIDAQAEFLAALEGLVDPAEKEQRVFTLLKAIIRRELSALPNVTLLLEGTNYSDALSSTNPPKVDMGDVRLIEPLRELFKDEIRRVGEELQMPQAIINRQPFPGSGLALRILSDVTQERLTLLREADDIFRREIEASGQSRRLWQYFASLANDPVPGAGGYVITLRAVQVIEGDIGVASRLPYDLLERVTEATLTRLPAIHRVLYDFTPSKSYERSRG